MSAETTRYDKVRKHIWNGDLLAWRRPASTIAWVGRGEHSHTALAVWRDDDQSSTLSVAEFREWVGARVITLREAVSQDPGVIDVYKPVWPDEKHYRIAERAATILYRQAGKQYAWADLARVALLQFPLASYLANRFWGFAPDVSDEKPAAWNAKKFCSYGVDWAYRRAIYELGYSTVWRPLNQRASRYVEPSDLTSSGSFRLAYRGLVL